MAEELPNFIDVRRRLEETPVLDGIVPAARLTRLPAPFRAAAPIALHLEFNPGGADRIRVTGRFSTSVDAVCQRCLNDMRVDVRRDIDVVLVDEEPATIDPEDDDDFVLLENGKWALAEFAEDELILACPMIPLHETSRCPVQLEPAETVERKRRPFAGLADMLKDSGHDTGK